MNAYVAYKVSTRVGKSVDWLDSSCPVSHCCPCLLLQTSLAMFRCKAFTVRRRYSDFLGLHEKLAVKQSLQGCIIPSPPEKSVVGACPLSTCMFFWCWSLFFHSRFNQQEWPRWRWEWTTPRRWSLWRGEELDWRGKCRCFHCCALPLVPHLFYMCAGIFRESCLTHHYYKIQMCESS